MERGLLGHFPFGADLAAVYQRNITPNHLGTDIFVLTGDIGEQGQGRRGTGWHGQTQEPAGDQRRGEGVLPGDSGGAMGIETEKEKTMRETGTGIYAGTRKGRRQETKDPLAGMQDARTGEEYGATRRETGSNAADGVGGHRDETEKTARGADTTGEGRGVQVDMGRSVRDT